ncbi:MAG: DNA-binding protein [Phycisphaerae bacterium]|nr:DNA-binding protein [Phycisphaerae bacterium]
MSLVKMQLEKVGGRERAAAETAASRLAELVGASSTATLRVSGPGTEALEIPAPAVRLLARCLAELARSKAVGVVALGSELSTQQAADMLGVSRPFIVKAIEEGRLPARRVGPRRRIAVEELVAYGAREDQASQDALGRLSDLDEQFGLVAAPDDDRGTIPTPKDRKSRDV